MKIYIDADASPVLKESLKIAKRHDLPVVIVKNYAHHIESDEAEVVSVDVENDSADLYISNHLQENDLVITQDYGLAMLALTKQAHPIHPDGRIFNEQNIQVYLAQRHVHAQMRRAGKRHRGPRKRKKEDDLRFMKALEEVILKIKKDR